MMTLNPSQVWQLRDRFFREVRRFFQERDYCEVGSPVAVRCPGAEVHLQFFSTTWRDFDGRAAPLWLRSSPELHMKQIMSQGLDRIFQIGPCFRNGGELSRWHHPEFTLLEWYRAHASFASFIDETLALIEHLHRSVAVEQVPWQEPVRLTVAEAFRDFAELELVDLDPGLSGKAIAAGVRSVKPDDDFETAFFKVLIERIEPRLRELGLVVLSEYPPSQSALALVKDGVAWRFEVYWQGVELSNAFLELTDPARNRECFRQINERRRQLNAEPIPEDRFFHEALERGVPPCCGNALGLDRLLALLCGADRLDPVLPLARQEPYYSPSF